MPDTNLQVRLNDSTGLWEYYHGGGWKNYPPSSNASGTDPGLMIATDKAKLDAIVNPYQPKGNITLPADFPLVADVQIGWAYHVVADVTDNDATKTNTGLSFRAGDLILWSGASWILATDAGYLLQGVHSVASLELSSVPTAGVDSFTIGANTYNFVAVVVNPTDILVVGGDAAATRANAVAVVGAVETEFTAHDVGTALVLVSVNPEPVNAVLTESITPAADVWNQDNTNVVASAHSTRCSVVTIILDATNAAAAFIVTFPFAVNHFATQSRDAAGAAINTTETIVATVGLANSLTVDPTAGATPLVATDVLTITAWG